MMLPMYRLAITGQPISGMVGEQQRPGLKTVEQQRRQHHRGTGGARNAKDSSGIMAALDSELFAASGPATPSMAPLPNCSGVLEVFFTSA